MSSEYRLAVPRDSRRGPDDQQTLHIAGYDAATGSAAGGMALDGTYAVLVPGDLGTANCVRCIRRYLSGH
jgi:hypothetical protein